MAKIELYKNKINNMPNIINNVRAEVSSYATALTKLYSKILAIDSPVVDKAIVSLSTAAKIQEEQISGLNATQRQIDAFVLTVQVTDNRVASCIRELTKMYEAVYNYSHGVSTDIATDSLAEWLYKNWGDRFTYGYALYNSEDLENMSQEEFDKYVEQLLALDYNSLSVEDKTRVQAVLDYLSGVSINGNMSETDKKKVSQYNSVYEKIYIDDAKAINEFFQKSAYNNNGELKSGITEDDIIYIKYIAYVSESPCHDIFFDNIANCYVESWLHAKDNGKGDLISAGSYYKSKAGINDETEEYEEAGVYLSLYLGKDGIENPRGAYNTFFHEIGHNIDDLLSEGQNSGTYFSTSKLYDGHFYDLLYTDVENNFKRSISNYNKEEACVSIDTDGQQKILDVLMGRQNQSSLNPRLSFAYRKIYEDYTGDWKGIFTQTEWTGKETGSLEGAENVQISDITGGITNNAVLGTYGHRDYGWYYEVDSNNEVIDRNGDGEIDYNDRLKKGDLLTSSIVPGGLQEMEFFAEYFAYEMTSDSDEDKARTYFPNSYSVMDDAMNRLVDKTRE